MDLELQSLIVPTMVFMNEQEIRGPAQLLKRLLPASVN